MSNIFFNDHTCFSSHASADEAVAEYPRDWPAEYTTDCLTEASRLTSNIAVNPEIPHENSLDLSGMYAPESVWSTDQLACPAATSTSSWTTQLFNTAFSLQPFPPTEVADFWQLPYPQHLSGCEETKLDKLGGTLTPHSVHTSMPLPECHSTWQPNDCSLSSRSNRLRAQFIPSPSRNVPYALSLDITRRVGLSPSVYQCQWFNGENPCNTVVTGTRKAIAQHLQAAHAIRLKGEPTTQVCLWTKCHRPMRRESIARHILAVHMQNKVPCPTCGSRFARADSMQRHRRTCHKGEQASNACNDLDFDERITY